MPYGKMLMVGLIHCALRQICDTNSYDLWYEYDLLEFTHMKLKLWPAPLNISAVNSEQ